MPKKWLDFSEKIRGKDFTPLIREEFEIMNETEMKNLADLTEEGELKINADKFTRFMTKFAHVMLNRINPITTEIILYLVAMCRLVISCNTTWCETIEWNMIYYSNATRKEYKSVEKKVLSCYFNTKEKISSILDCDIFNNKGAEEYTICYIKRLWEEK